MFVKILSRTLFLSLLSVLILTALYFVMEPKIGRSATSGPFSIRQEIGAEIAFLVGAANVTMSGPLNGLTGGNATGTTQAVVQTNNAAGYRMDISFTDSDSDGTIMRRDLGGSNSGSIKNYSTSTYNRMVTPSFGFSFASTAAMFAYTVTASNTNDIAQNFLHNGTSLCGTGSGTTPDLCWMAPSTTAYRIIETGSAAPTGSTSTIRFRVYIPNAPNPAVDSGFYTATATLTAVNI